MCHNTLLCAKVHLVTISDVNIHSIITAIIITTIIIIFFTISSISNSNSSSSSSRSQPSYQTKYPRPYVYSPSVSPLLYPSIIHPYLYPLKLLISFCFLFIISSTTLLSDQIPSPFSPLVSPTHNHKPCSFLFLFDSWIILPQPSYLTKYLSPYNYLFPLSKLPTIPTLSPNQTPAHCNFFVLFWLFHNCLLSSDRRLQAAAHLLISAPALSPNLSPFITHPDQ